MIHGLKWFLPLTLALLTSGCWVKKTMCRGLHNAFPGPCRPYTRPHDDGAAPVSIAPTSSIAPPPLGGPGFALTRLTPEQLSNDLAAAANFGAAPTEFRPYLADIGQNLDYLVLQFGAPLGGIDFVATSRRDPMTKAQTLLVTRVVAWQMAGAAVFKEVNTAASERQIFTQCQLESDRPFMDSDRELPEPVQAVVRDGAARWAKQVEELFFRFYARPPTADEVNAVQAAFVSTFQNEGYAPGAWLTVLYALLASQEFWHL